MSADWKSLEIRPELLGIAQRRQPEAPCVTEGGWVAVLVHQGSIGGLAVQGLENERVEDLIVPIAKAGPVPDDHLATRRRCHLPHEGLVQRLGAGTGRDKLDPAKTGFGHVIPDGHSVGQPGLRGHLMIPAPPIGTAAGDQHHRRHRQYPKGHGSASPVRDTTKRSADRFNADTNDGYGGVGSWGCGEAGRPGCPPSPHLVGHHREQLALRVLAVEAAEAAEGRPVRRVAFDPVHVGVGDVENRASAPGAAEPGTDRASAVVASARLLRAQPGPRASWRWPALLAIWVMRDYSVTEQRAKEIRAELERRRGKTLLA